MIQLALNLLDDPQEMYSRATDATRRRINQTFFEQFWVDQDLTITYTRRQPFEDFTQAAESYRQLKAGHSKRPSKAGAPEGTMAVLLAGVSWSTGSNKAALVEVPGIEPGSFVAEPGLLRAHPAISCRSYRSRRPAGRTLAAVKCSARPRSRGDR